MIAVAEALLCGTKATVSATVDATGLSTGSCTNALRTRTANIGARRLHTVLERLLDDLLYNAPDIGRQTIPITKAYVVERLGALAADDDLARFIL